MHCMTSMGTRGCRVRKEREKMHLEVTGDDVVVGIGRIKGEKRLWAREARAGAARMLSVGARGA